MTQQQLSNTLTSNDLATIQDTLGVINSAIKTTHNMATTFQTVPQQQTSNALATTQDTLVIT